MILRHPKRYTVDDSPPTDTDTEDSKVSNTRQCVFVAETNLPTLTGHYRVRAYRDEESGLEPIVLITGDVHGRDAVPIRVHDQCFLSEVLCMAVGMK